MAKKKQLMFIGILIVGMLFIGVLKVAHKVNAQEEEEGEEVGHGVMPAWVPYSDKSPTLDGVISTGEYPTDGKLDLEDFGAEVYLFHNETHMFIAIEFNGTGFGGIGLKPMVEEEEEEKAASGAEEEESGYAFFLADVNNSKVLSKVVEGTSNLSEVIEDLTGELEFEVAGKETNGKTVLEFAIEMYHVGFEEEEEEEAGATTAAEEFLPRMGYLLELVVVYSSKGTLDNPTVNVNASEEEIAYVLRPGENIEDFEKIFEGKAPIENVFGVTLLFIISVLGVLVMYFPPLRSRFFS